MIQSEPKQDFDDYPAQFKQHLKRIFDWKTRGNTTRIPVRGDYSVVRLIESLQVLSKAADPDLKLARQGTDKDDEMTGKDVVKKKKRWWNPFD